MLLGLCGGSFDPVHFGHLLMAETAREACELDEVWFVPARISPFKPDQPLASDRDRVEMLRLAIAGHPQFRVSELELHRAGPSYTVDTLRAVRQERPDDELFLIVGADSLAEFPRWREPREILQLASVIAVNRGDVSTDAAKVVDELTLASSGRIREIAMPPVGLSSTAIREFCRTGRSIRYQTPRSVELYIREHGLYEGGDEG